jgi:hypothetical protein
MAQRLMAENNIEQSAVINESNEFIPTKKSVVKGSVYDSKSIIWWRKNIGMVIAKNFKCECYVSRKYETNSLTFLGLKDDVILAKIAFDFASEAIESSCKSYIKKCKKDNPNIDTTGVRNDYLIGWIKGIKDQFAEQIEKNNWGLVLVKDALVVQAKEKMNLTKGRTSSVSVSNNQDARAEGYKNGKNFNVKAKRLA